MKGFNFFFTFVFYFLKKKKILGWPTQVTADFPPTDSLSMFLSTFTFLYGHELLISYYLVPSVTVGTKISLNS